MCVRRLNALTSSSGQVFAKVVIFLSESKIKLRLVPNVETGRRNVFVCE